MTLMAAWRNRTDRYVLVYCDDGSHKVCEDSIGNLREIIRIKADGEVHIPNGACIGKLSLNYPDIRDVNIDLMGEGQVHLFSKTKCLMLHLTGSAEQRWHQLELLAGIWVDNVAHGIVEPIWHTASNIRYVIDNP